MRSPSQGLLLITILLGLVAASAWGQQDAPSGLPGATQHGASPAADSAYRSATAMMAEKRIRARLVNLLQRGRNNGPAAATVPVPASAGVTAASSLPPSLIQSQTASGVAPDGTATLPLWTFRVDSSRDGNPYPGVMVGRDPFKNPGTTKVPTLIIPLIIETQTVVDSIDPTTGAILSTHPGVTRFNPTVADSVCLTSPNNIPTKLLRQSPVFTATNFNFGGTPVGTTQYGDAFQRANFWTALGGNTSQYHVLLDPVQILDPIVVRVPAIYGLALTNGLLFGPPAFCAPLGLVDIQWFDVYLRATILPALVKKGVSPSNLPIFLTYNTWWSYGFLTGLNAFSDYHGLTGFPIETQTYAVATFDSTLVVPAFADIAPLAQSVADWMDDPMAAQVFGYNLNPAPLWGFPGFSGFCGFYLEPSVPFNGVDLPPVVMPNGFAYTLPELAFFSWFFGAPSIGVDGWFSNNGTFLSDAGPPCQE